MKQFSSFPLFQSHLDLAHHYWKSLVKPGDIVIDATCGNGNDILVLANLALTNENEGLVFGIDSQAEAIESTRQHLIASIDEKIINHIILLHQCHSTFPDSLSSESVSLIVYNLGYLPKGNKTLTTMTPTTLQSLQQALRLIKSGGAISLTCYPGHDEGKREEDAVKEFAASLDPRQWSCCYHSWLNRRNAPSLLLLQKAI